MNEARHVTLLTLLTLLVLPCECQPIWNATHESNNLVTVCTDKDACGTVCVENDTNVADTACAVLNYPKQTAFLVSASSSIPPIVRIIGCSAYSSDSPNMWDFNQACKVFPFLGNGNCSHLAVSCLNVSLEGSGLQNEGRVRAEVNGVSGTICAKRAGTLEAFAVCRSLGFSNPVNSIPLTGSYLPQNRSTSVIELLSCQKDQELKDCQVNINPSADCDSRFSQLSVRCQEEPVTPMPPPTPKLECFKQFATVSFASSRVNQSELELKNVSSNCNSTFNQNSTTLQLRIDTYSECSYNVNDTDPLVVEYQLLLHFRGRKNSAGHLILNPINYQLGCRVGKDSLATAKPIDPELVTVHPDTGGENGSQVLYDLFKERNNDEFKSQVNGPVPIGTRLYGRVMVNSPGPDDFLVVYDCWALNESSSNSATTTRYNMTINRLPADSNTQLYYISNTVGVVEFQAFQFVSNAATTNVYFFCNTVVCRQFDPSPRCSRNPDAFRRSPTSRNSLRSAKLKNSRAGPFTFVDERASGWQLNAGCATWLTAFALLTQMWT